MNDLLKLRAEKRKTEIGFESHQRKQEQHQMKKERHKWEVVLAEYKVDAQQLRDLNHDMAESERLWRLQNQKES
jgi:hypothetical protein